LRGGGVVAECVVDVCVCTYRRDSLTATLRSLAHQRLPESVRLRVIVADNDAARSAEALVAAVTAETGLDCLYVVAPARNISIARNACLDASTAPLLAFIDDDEVAEPTWLAELLAQHARGLAAVVFGPVSAAYDARPIWLREADLHSVAPTFFPDGSIHTGYAGNVLLDRQRLGDALAARRFDPALGRSGGEDVAFFHALRARGVRMAFAPQAVVHERVPPQRARLRWLLARAFRSGQSFARLQLDDGVRRGALLSRAVAKSVACLACAAPMLRRAAAWRRWLVRAALHAGVAATCLGLRDLRLY
jgi:succinoglycan biosynthesis protein ExoM